MVDPLPGRLQVPPESPEEIARDISAVAHLAAVPILLDVLCETTGMGFSAVARVTDQSWTLCAVKDLINFGLQPGGRLELETTLCIEAKRSRSAIVIDHASQDPRYRNHHTPRIYKIESYVSVPIVLGDVRSPLRYQSNSTADIQSGRQRVDAWRSGSTGRGQRSYRRQ